MQISHNGFTWTVVFGGRTIAGHRWVTYRVFDDTGVAVCRTGNVEVGDATPEALQEFIWMQIFPLMRHNQRPNYSEVNRDIAAEIARINFGT